MGGNLLEGGKPAFSRSCFKNREVRQERLHKNEGKWRVNKKLDRQTCMERWALSPAPLKASMSAHAYPSTLRSEGRRVSSRSSSVT